MHNFDKLCIFFIGDIMKYEIPIFKTITIEGLDDIVDLDYQLKDTSFSDDEINGVLEVRGIYKNKDGIETPFNEDLNFTVLSPNDNEKSLDITHFDYEVVKNHGLEILFTIEVEVDDEKKAIIKNDMVNKLEEEIRSETKNVVRDEEIIEAKTKLKNIVDSSEHGEEEDYLLPLEDKYVNYCYHFINNENEIESLAREYNVNVTDIYKVNKYNIKDRVLIIYDSED